MAKTARKRNRKDFDTDETKGIRQIGSKKRQMTDRELLRRAMNGDWEEIEDDSEDCVHHR